MRRAARLMPLALATASVGLFATAALGATRTITMEPDSGAPGTTVHIAIIDTGPHEPERDLVMWPYSSIASECGPSDSLTPLGVITWTGSNGAADFVVPDLPAGDYYVTEQLPGVSPPCMPVGTFAVTTIPDTALAAPPDQSAIPTGVLLLAAILAVAVLRLAIIRIARLH